MRDEEESAAKVPPTVDFAKAVRRPDIKEVELAGNMPKADIEEALEALAQENIEYLLIKNQRGGFGNCLKHAKGLKTLEFVNCELAEPETVELMYDLESSTVEVFSVSKPFCLLNTGEIAALRRMLRNAQHLNAIHLPIEWFHLSEDGAICKAIAESAIETLALSIPAMWIIQGSNVLRELARAVANVGARCRLHTVNLEFSHIEDPRDLIRLANALPSDRRVNFVVGGCTYGVGGRATRNIDYRLLELVIESSGRITMSGVYAVGLAYEYLLSAVKKACDNYDNALQ